MDGVDPAECRAIALTIAEGFNKHYQDFRAISAAAKSRFERGDWAAVQRANVERIELYDRRVLDGVRELERHPAAANEQSWPAIKLAFIGLLANHQQPELAQTYYNSVASRVLRRTYYNNETVFLRSVVSTEHIESSEPAWRCYDLTAEEISAVLRRMLLRLQCPWEDLERDLSGVVSTLSTSLPRLEGPDMPQAQILSSLFYRNQAAYLIGCFVRGQARTPFAIAIRQNKQHELYLDALLTHRMELGMIFSLARAYFMVDMEVPSAVVQFLQGIFPEKPAAELYTALGLQKQGKTLCYRDLVQHLRHSSDRFVPAPGVRGMVMVVFTLPSFPYVFKVIRDVFEPPKDSDRAAVMAQYRLVKNHDRVGRLADALEYSNVAFPLDRFDPLALRELEAKAPSLVHREGDRLVLKHLYVERRMTPLDLYLRSAQDEAELRHGLIEYGNCIRELAFANIFPGDLLPKNFGVTRFGRVVFYDFDELAPLSQCNFRRIPTPVHDEDEYSQEPWFSVGVNDIFPEEWPAFLFSLPRWKEIFLEHHADLMTPEFWQSIQKRIAAGEQIAFYPYPPERRFHHAHHGEEGLSPDPAASQAWWPSLVAG